MVYGYAFASYWSGVRLSGYCGSFIGCGWDRSGVVTAISSGLHVLCVVDVLVVDSV